MYLSSRPPFCTFCSSLRLSFPLPPSARLLSSCLIVTPPPPLDPSLFRFPPTSFFFVSPPTSGRPADSLSRQPRWHRVSLPRLCPLSPIGCRPTEPIHHPRRSTAAPTPPLVLCGAPWSSTTTHINLLNDPGPKRINTHFQGAA